MIEPQVVELLSKIIGRKLDNRDVTRPVLFLATLIAVLLGVMLADKTVTDEEKSRWQKTVNRFIPPEDNIRELAKLFSKGIREQKVYVNAREIGILLMPFSQSERLLLIGFGSEMSFADGNVDPSEKQYLLKLTSLAKLNPHYLEVLEAGFTQRSVTDIATLEELRSLLDPARFQALDTPFVNAAHDLLSALPATTQPASKSQLIAYDRLKAFQTSRKQLDQLCDELYQILQACSDRNFLPQHFGQDIAKISRKLQSQRFRVAVVGEFSQGKSTLLNALLGEEIQPVRAIPCSGTITTLRHGQEKRVLCCLKDGQQQEISVDEYKEKASIPKAAAVGQRSDELATSDLEEIIFEHPHLELCKSGVEILDSPGLNEHPKRTAITEKLLQETDAVLFLTNASRLLPEKEKELIQSVRAQLMGTTEKSPAENLFLVVNFMDLLDSEEDRQDVTQRLEEFVTREKLLTTDKNRIHYISAKGALKKQDEYLRSFSNFTQALEQFLSHERGAMEIGQSVDRIQDLIKLALVELQQAEDLLDGKVELSKAEKLKVLEQIGEASGRAVKIHLLQDQVMDQVIEEFVEAWEQWQGGLRVQLAKKSQQWSSEHSTIWSRDQLIADYAQQFNTDLSAELNDWVETQFKQRSLQPWLKYFDDQVNQEMSAIQAGIEAIDLLQESQSSAWVFYTDDGVDFGDFGLFGSLGLAGLGVVAFVPAIILTGPILVILSGLVAGGLLGTGVGGVLGIDQAIREKVFEAGWDQFDASLKQTFCQNIDEMIDFAFRERRERVKEVVKRTILLYENLLEQQDKTHQKTLTERETEKTWIAQKRLELEALIGKADALRMTN